MKSKIEKNFIKTSNKELLLSSFMMLGAAVTCFSVPTIGTTLMALSFPFLILTIETRYRIEKNKLGILGSNFTDGINGRKYKKSFNEWLKTYIEESNNITEQKYKLLFILMFLEHKYIKYQDLIGGNSIGEDLFKKISTQLMIQQQSKYNLLNLTNSNSEISYQDFFDEDSKNEDNIRIAKVIYEDFKYLGMVGKNFWCFPVGIVPVLLNLQDYQISKEDEKYIENLINKNRLKIGNEILLDLDYDKRKQHIIEKLIDNQTGDRQLKLLSDFFNKIESDIKEEKEELELIGKTFFNKIEYLKLKETLIPKVEKLVVKNKL